MNTKQKMKYTALGAVIMLIGMVVGATLTPPLDAQHKGVFDTITCRGLTVVDQVGNERVVLLATAYGGRAYVYDKNGNVAVTVGAIAITGNGISAYQEGKLAVSFRANEDVRGLNVYDKAERNVIGLGTMKDGNHLYLNDLAGKRSFKFAAYPHRNELAVYDKSSGAGIGFYTDSNEARQTKWNPPKEENKR